MMKAVIRKNLVFKDEYKSPVLSKSTVRVKIKATALNPVDYKLGWPIFGPVICTDFSGVIDEVGADVKGLCVGDEVYGWGDGALAEYIVVSPDTVSPKPKCLSYAESAALPVVYLTGLQAYLTFGGLKEGGRVLIIGASGGTGIAAIQLAKAIGASDIVGVCSGRNEELVRSLGCTEVVDYTKHNLLDYFKDEAGSIPESKKFDVVYDVATGSGGGEDYLALSRPLLREATSDKQHGQYVSINGTPTRWIRSKTIGLPKNEHMFMMKANADDFKKLTSFIENEESGEANFKPIIACSLPFTQKGVNEGFTKLKGRRTVGKIIIEQKTDDLNEHKGDEANEQKVEKADESKEDQVEDNQESAEISDSSKVEESPGNTTESNEQPENDENKQQKEEESEVSDTQNETEKENEVTEDEVQNVKATEEQSDTVDATNNSKESEKTEN